MINSKKSVTLVPTLNWNLMVCFQFYSKECTKGKDKYLEYPSNFWQSLKYYSKMQLDRFA